MSGNRLCYQCSLIVIGQIDKPKNLFKIFKSDPTTDQLAHIITISGDHWIVNTNWKIFHVFSSKRCTSRALSELFSTYQFNSMGDGMVWVGILTTSSFPILDEFYKVKEFFNLSCYSNWIYVFLFLFCVDRINEGIYVLCSSQRCVQNFWFVSYKNSLFCFSF